MFSNNKSSSCFVQFATHFQFKQKPFFFHFNWKVQSYRLLQKCQDTLIAIKSLSQPYIIRLTYVLKIKKRDKHLVNNASYSNEYCKPS